MNVRREWKAAVLVIGGFLAAYHLPSGNPRFDTALLEAFHLVRWYAREHVLLCLVPAFFIAGAIGVFISKGSVMKYLGAGANKIVAYGVASVSGSILAVCSCTVLPLFAGIYRMGAGLGPATAFLYSGPAINVLAIILTARVLGIELGIARAVGAIVFSIIIGILMHVLFRREETAKAAAMVMPEDEPARPLWQNTLWFAVMVGILVSATWGAPASDTGFFTAVFGIKWHLTALFAAALGFMLVRWYGIRWWHVAVSGIFVAVAALLYPETPLVGFSTGIIALSIVAIHGGGETAEWFDTSWGFAKLILPLLFLGVLAAGFLLGRVGHEGIIPSGWVAAAVGGNSLRANFFASFAGAFMYFATLTEVPILQGLLGSGMGKGPALALLLAGPALSLPNMLVIRSVLGTKKTAVFVVLVIVMATISGVVFGAFLG